MDALAVLIGERMKGVREKAELSQSDLAARIGATQSVVSQYERGIRKPSTDILLKISKELACSTDFLLGGTSETVFLDEDMVSLLGQYKNLCARDKVVVKQIIMFLSGAGLKA